MATAVAAAHITAQQRLRQITARGVAAAWGGLPRYDEDQVDPFLALVTPLVLAAQRQAVALTDGFLALVLGRQPLGIGPDRIAAAARAGADPLEVYRRPFVTVWADLSAGRQWDDAVAAGLSRATSTAETDVQLAMRETLREVGESDDLILGYQRVPDADACDFCKLVAGQRYTTDQLMPIHNRCGCGVDVITAANCGDFTGKRENDLSVTRDGMTADVREHGELGPVLIDGAHHFTDLGEIEERQRAGGSGGGGGRRQPPAPAGGDGDGEADDLASRLDEWFEDQGAWARTESERTERIRDWQATSRTYELIQAVLRSEQRLEDLDADEREMVLTTIAVLTAGINEGQTREPITVYRGVRSLQRTFGTADPDALLGEHQPPGFLATSIHRAVALTEFSSHIGALLEIRLPAGVPALWVAAVGDPRLRRQGELLLDDQTRFNVTAHRRENGRLVLSCEVIP